MKKILAASLVAGISSIVAGAPQANAFTLTSVGSFFDVEPGTAGNVNGVGTDTLSWGFPYPSPGPQSSFKFEGVNTAITAPAVGDSWFGNFGKFTHNNNPITLAGIPITGAKLKVNFGFNDAANPLSAIFKLEHKETPNKKPCEYAGSGICPDTVVFTFLSGDESGTFLDGNKEVQWSVNQFFSSKPDGTGINFDNTPIPGPSSVFTTDEPGQQFAYLNGGGSTIKEVPLETDIAGVALVAGLGYLGYRRRQAGKQVIAD